MTSQCRAAVLLRDAVIHDVEHWCEKHRQERNVYLFIYLFNYYGYVILYFSILLLYYCYCYLFKGFFTFFKAFSLQVQEAGGKEEDGGAGLRILLQQAGKEAKFLLHSFQAERKVGTMLRESKA